MKHILTHITMFVFTVMSTILLGEAQAQMGTNPNITPVVIMTPNPSPFLSDWQSQRECIRLNVVLAQPMNQPVKLMAQVSLNGQVVARTKQEKMPMLTLQQGMNSFVAADIIPLQAISFMNGIDQASQRTGRLPEGSYQICIWFANAETGFPLISAPCQPFMIQQVNPVTLILPQNGASFSTQNTQTLQTGNTLNGSGGRNLSDFYDLKIDENGHAVISYSTDKELPQVTLAQLSRGNKIGGDTLKGFRLIAGITETPYIHLQSNVNNWLGLTDNPDQGVIRFVQPVISGNSGSASQPLSSLNFQWLPPMPAPSVPVQYRLRIVPVLPGQSVEQAMQTATPALEQDGISTTTFSGTESLSRLFSLAGGISSFAWSVQAHDALRNPIGSNNGWAIPNTFTIGGTMTSAQDIPRSFFDIFFDLDLHDILNNIDVKPEPCGYTYKEKLQKVFGPWKLFKSWSQYANTYKRTVYRAYRVVRCTLMKGHGGPHQCSAETYYVKESEEKVTEAPPGPSNPTDHHEPPQYLTDDPPAKQQMDQKGMDKIPTKEEADKKDAADHNDNGGKDNGGGQNGGTDNGGKSNGGTDNGGKGNGGTDNGSGDGNNGGGLVPGNKDDGAKEPCPEVKKTLLRTVIGSWKKGPTVVRSATYKKTTMAWADVTWTRDIWNVYLVRHCTLEKGHGGDHVWDAGHEEWQKYGTITEKLTYGVGVPQKEPTDHWSDKSGVPVEDPPRGAIYMK